AEVFGEAQVGGERFLADVGIVASGVHVNDIELGIEAASHAGGARDQILRGGIGADADGDAFSYRPVFLDVLGRHVVVQAAVHLFGNLAEGEFAKGYEIAAAEEVVQRLLDFGGHIDVAATHAVLQGFGGEIDHDRFVGGHGHPVGNGFANGD